MQLSEALSERLPPVAECNGVGLLLQRLGIELLAKSELEISELLHLSPQASTHKLLIFSRIAQIFSNHIRCYFVDYLL
jgi:hypothetical protein